MFRGCTSLTSLPENMFNDCSKIDCSSMISNSIVLTSLPENMFNNCSEFDCTNMFYSSFQISGDICREGMSFGKSILSFFLLFSADFTALINKFFGV